MDFIASYLAEVGAVAGQIQQQAVAELLDILVDVRETGGRLFVLGVGGSAGNASHAVNDFRKIAGIEAYAPTDNVSELTARINDEGWEGAYAEWLRASHLNARDAILVLSVGGGDLERQISANLVRAVQYARQIGARVCGIVGRDGGFTARAAHACVVVPTVNAETITAHAVVWHLLVAHPRLRVQPMKWESVVDQPVSARVSA
jgi:D-sedoheptulose 7-phosphate isomerase